MGLMAGVARGRTKGSIPSATGIIETAGGSLLSRSVARNGTPSTNVDTVMTTPKGDGTLVEHRHGDTSAPTRHVGSGLHGAMVAGLKMGRRIG